MLVILRQTILKPLVQRVGTAIAAFLVAQGIGPEMIDQIVTGLTAAVLVAVDLIADYSSRKGK